MMKQHGWVVLAAAIAAAAGCGGPSTAGGRPPGEPSADSSSLVLSRDSLSPTVSTAVPSDTALRSGAVSPATSSDSLPLIPLRAILAGSAEVGRRVRVEGVCIGYSRVLAVGPQPRTRSDWQLVDDSVAVWVVGPYPPGCSGTVPAEQADTFTVVVASDTLPALGAAPPRPRLYLIHTPPE